MVEKTVARGGVCSQGKGKTGYKDTSEHAVLPSQVTKITHHYYLTRLPLGALAVQDPTREGDTPATPFPLLHVLYRINYSVSTLRTRAGCVYCVRDV